MIEEEQRPNALSSAEVPSSVANRILLRIGVFSGIPVLFGLCLLPLFYYLKVHPHVDDSMSDGIGGAGN